MPLYKLLGGTNEPLPTYHSCGLGIAEPADVAREAKEMLVEHGGFSHMKLRMGRNYTVGEVAAYKALRSAIGPDVLISCDFNQGLPSATALDLRASFTAVNAAFDRVAMHAVRRTLLEAQARAAGLPLTSSRFPTHAPTTSTSAAWRR